MTRRIAPDAVGLGLRPPFMREAARGEVPVDFWEVIAENFLGDAPLPRERLAAVSRHRPVLAHGVSLNLGGTDPLDMTHVSRLAALVRDHDMPWVTDHLCWTASEGVDHHDLLPLPHAEALVPWLAHRIRTVQRTLPVPFGVENVSTYVRFARDDGPEWTFLRRVVEAADCGLLLDINNLYVSCRNHGWDAQEYLAAVPWDRVLYVHLAGHTVRADGLLHDTHDHPVSDGVWTLLRDAWRAGGPFPVLLEWDDRIPPLEVLLRELDRVREWCR